MWLTFSLFELLWTSKTQHGPWAQYPDILTVGHHRIFLPSQPSPYATSTLNGNIITYKSNCSSNRGNKLFLIVSVFLTSFPKKSSGNSLNVTYGSHNPGNQLTTTILQWPVYTTEESICIQLFEITVVKFRYKMPNSTMKHDKGKQFWSFILLVKYSIDNRDVIYDLILSDLQLPKWACYLVTKGLRA